MCLSCCQLMENSQGGPVGGGSSHSGGDREVLPDTVKPVHYTLQITPDLDTCTFAGTVDIE